MWFKILLLCTFILPYITKLIKIDPSLNHLETVIFKDQLYLFGGNHSSGAYQVAPVKLDLTKPFDLPPPAWNVLTEDVSKKKLPGIIGHRVALDETLNRLYLVGGRTFNSNSQSRSLSKEKIQLWVYDFITDIWEDLSLKGTIGFPSARYFHSLNYHHGKLYLYGGRSLDDSKTLGDFHVYSIDAGKWSQISFSDLKNCPSSRSEHTATIVSRNRIAILGGKGDKVLTDINTVYFISTQDHLCSKRKAKLENAPSNRFSFTSTALLSSLIIIGGKDSLDNIQSDIYSLEIEKMYWTLISKNYFVPRVYHSSVLYGDLLFLLYGSTSHPSDGFQILKTGTFDLIKKYHPDMKKPVSGHQLSIFVIFSIIACCLLFLSLAAILVRRTLQKKNSEANLSSKNCSGSIFSIKKQTNNAETLSSSEKYTSGLWSQGYVDSSKRSRNHDISLPASNIEMKMYIDDITLQANSLSIELPQTIVKEENCSQI